MDGITVKTVGPNGGVGTERIKVPAGTLVITGTGNNFIQSVTITWRNEKDKYPSSGDITSDPTGVSTSDQTSTWTVNPAEEVQEVTFTNNNASKTFEVVGLEVTYSTKYTVTFDGNGHGTPATASIFDYNVTLPTCAITDGRTDLYRFVGWSTSSTATSGTAAGATYNPTKDITLYAVYKYYVNVEAGAGGEVTAKYNNKDGDPFSPTFVPLNTVLWFEATPSSSAYSFTGWGTATTSKDNPLTYTIRDCKTFKAHFITSHGAGDEVWFARDRDAVTNGTTQSTKFTGVNTVTEENAVKSNWQVSGSYTIGGYAYAVTARGTTGGPINITFTVPSGKVATLYGLAVSSGSTARPLTLTCASPAYSDATQSTAASSTDTEDGFSYSGLLPGEYTLKSTGNGAVVFLYLDLEDATSPTITTQPVGAEYYYGATASAMTVSATAAAGGALSYQWYTCNADGSSASSIGGATSSSYTPPTNSVGTNYYKVIVTEAGGTSTTSNVATVVVNTNPNNLTLNSNVVSAKVGGSDMAVTYSTSSTGTVSATSADGSIATVTVNEGTKTITVHPEAAGNTTITVSQAATTGYAASTAGSDLVISVTVVAVDKKTNETLFYRDFTDSEWSEATFVQGKTETPDVNYDVTTYSKDSSKKFSWSSEGLLTPANNMQQSNYFAAIPLKRINGTVDVTVNVKKVSANKDLYYCVDQETAVGTPSSTSNKVKIVTNATSGSFQVTDLDDDKDYVLYIGSNAITMKDITITTPTPDGLTSPSITSVTASSPAYVDATTTVTCTDVRGYNYKWYVGTENNIAKATEIYGETLSKLDYKFTEPGTYYVFCKAFNSVGEASSSVAITVTYEPATPTLSFNMTTTSYNNNLNAWSEGLTPVLNVEPARLASTILPSVTYSVTNLAGEASSDLVYTDAGVAASSTANGEGYLSLHNKGGKYKVTATYVASGVSGIADGTYVTETPLQIKVIQGYDNALAKGDPVSVGGVKMVYDGDGDVAAIVTFGGWTHGNAERTPENWTKDPTKDNTASTDANKDEKWNTITKADGTKMDDYDWTSKGNNDSRSESKGFVEWEEGKEGIKANPYSLPCRGSYITVTPIKNGTMTIYLSQNGSQKPAGTVSLNGPRIYYWYDQNGNVIPCESAESYSKLSSGYTLSNQKTSIEERWAAHGVVDIDAGTTELDRAIRDHWNDNDTENQDVIPYKNGYFMPEDWQSVKYSANLLAGNTYYFFSNRTKMGYNGLNYAPVRNDGDIVIKHAVAEGDPEDSETVHTLASMHLYENVDFDAPSETTSYKQVYLHRTMKKDTWTTICLPFSVSKEQVEALFGKGTVFLGYDGFSGGTLSFIYHAYDYLLAGQPYFIKPTGVDANGDDLESVESGYIGAKESRNYILFPNVTISRDVEAKDVDGKKDVFEFSGSFDRQTMTPYSYYLTANGELGYSSSKTYKLGGYRAFLYNESKEANSLVLDFEIKDFSDDGNVPTAVNDLMDYITEHGIEIHTRNGVYTMNGQKIAEKPENLAPGMYIINGRKVVIR